MTIASICERYFSKKILVSQMSFPAGKLFKKEEGRSSRVGIFCRKVRVVWETSRKRTTERQTDNGSGGKKWPLCNWIS